jgi:hypothetical protein
MVIEVNGCEINPRKPLAAAGAQRRQEAIHHAREAMAIRDPFRSAFSSYWPFSARLRADSQVDQMLKEQGID